MAKSPSVRRGIFSMIFDIIQLNRILFILLMARKPQPAESVGDESPNGLSAGFTIIFTLGLFFALRLNVLVDSLNISSSSCCHKIALSPQRTSP